MNRSAKGSSRLKDRTPIMLGWMDFFELFPFFLVGSEWMHGWFWSSSSAVKGGSSAAGGLAAAGAGACLARFPRLSSPLLSDMGRCDVVPPPRADAMQLDRPPCHRSIEALKSPYLQRSNSRTRLIHTIQITYIMDWHLLAVV